MFKTINKNVENKALESIMMNQMEILELKKIKWQL